MEKTPKSPHKRPYSPTPKSAGKKLSRFISAWMDADADTPSRLPSGVLPAMLCLLAADPEALAVLLPR